MTKLLFDIKLLVGILQQITVFLYYLQLKIYWTY